MAAGSASRATSSGPLRVAAALWLLTLLLYLPAMRFDFVDLDDPLYVAENPMVARGLTADGLRWAFTALRASNWHPLTWLSHMLDAQLFGLRPGGHHLTSILLHAANAALLVLLLQGLTGALGASALAAALFALHPLHVESVAWIAERKDVLSTFLGLLALLAYRRYLGRPGAGRLGLALACYALGLMSKPMLVSLPLLFLVLDWWPLGRWGMGGAQETASRGRLLREKAPFFLLAAASGLVTLAVQARSGAAASLGNVPLPLRVANALESCALYLLRTVVPRRLAAFYPLRVEALGVWRVALAALCLAIVGAAAVRLRRRAPFLAAGWLWYLITLLPIIGLIQVGDQARADRYTYLALTGIFVAVAWGLAAWAGERARRRAVGVACALAVLALLTGLTARQLTFWRDGEALFRRALAVSGGHHLLHNGLGRALERKGREDEAATQYRRALALDPAYAPAANNLGVLLLRKGRTDEARELLLRAVRGVPTSADARYNLGSLLFREGDDQGAAAILMEALRLNPDHPRAHNNLGVILFRAGRTAEAREHFAAAVRLRPDYDEARRNLAATGSGLANEHRK